MSNYMLDGIERTFFLAMLGGYAGGGQKRTISGLPGSKTIPFTNDDFVLLDYWFVNQQTQASFGQTIIWHRDTPVWHMSYQGVYAESAISFLKLALQDNYGRFIFLGGRGPDEFKRSGMTYVNKPTLDGWLHFKGREEVFGLGNESLGWHEYQGMYIGGG